MLDFVPSPEMSSSKLLIVRADFEKEKITLSAQFEQKCEIENLSRKRRNESADDVEFVLCFFSLQFFDSFDLW
jgi:hypothetical protein